MALGHCDYCAEWCDTLTPVATVNGQTVCICTLCYALEFGGDVDPFYESLLGGER